MTNSPVTYALVVHSGLGFTAVEHTSVTPSQAAEVQRLGGVLSSSWADGDALATAALVYRGGAIAPSGVRGTFSPAQVPGLPAVFIPDAEMTTFLALRAQPGRASDDVLMATAAAILQR